MVRERWSCLIAASFAFVSAVAARAWIGPTREAYP